ncbi:hypothetical protein AVEN_171435-2-1, partial [Araneus ventricosus]
RHNGRNSEGLTEFGPYGIDHHGVQQGKAVTHSENLQTQHLSWC